MKAASAGIQGAMCCIALFLFLATTPAGAQLDDVLTMQSAPAVGELLRDAEARLARGDAESAWRLLSPRETEFAGNPLFDYLLGVAALDTGRRSEAIFALRRSLAVEPRFSGARMELARAYFETGNSALARPLFVALRNEDPPAGVRDIIDGYIRAIDARPAPRRSRFTPYAELAGGYDSNANGSTATQQYFGFTLSPDNVETDSPFYEFGAGFHWTLPTSRSNGWYLGARVGHRANPDASFVDSTIVNGIASWQWRSGAFFGRAGADGYLAWRDGASNESYAGVDALLGRNLHANWDLTAGLRGGALRYADSIEILDVNRILYTLGVNYRPSPLTILTFEAIGGQDSERDPTSPYGNSKLGARLALTAPLGDNTLYASLGSLKSDYDGLFFGAAREDTQLSGLLQVEFRDVLVDGLSLIPRVRYVDNDSDLELYAYKRTEIGLLLRWMPQ